MDLFEKHPVLGRFFVYFNFLILPEDERLAAPEFMNGLTSLWEAVRQFNHALRLFDLCDLERPHENDWKLIAAKDGAWSISNMGFVMQHFRAEVGSHPTLKSLIDHAKLRNAMKKYERAFPDFPEMRHALAHIPDSKKDQRTRDRNYYKGPFISDGQEIEGDQTMIMVHQSLNGRIFQTTFAGRLLRYEVSKQTLDELVVIKDTFFSGFQAIEEKSLRTPHFIPEIPSGDT